MKKKSLVGSALVAVLLCASNASAYNRSGAECEPGAGALPAYTAQSVSHTGFLAGTLVCPFDANANLGTHVQWSFRVVDNSPGAGAIQCTGRTYDSNGNLVASAVSNSSSDGVGTLSAVTAFQTAITHSHVAECTMPGTAGGTASEIRRYELF